MHPDPDSHSQNGRRQEKSESKVWYQGETGLRPYVSPDKAVELLLSGPVGEIEEKKIWEAKYRKKTIPKYPPKKLTLNWPL